MPEHNAPATPMAYEPPEIKDHGTLRALTLAKPNGGGDFFNSQGASFSSLGP